MLEHRNNATKGTCNKQVISNGKNVGLKQSMTPKTLQKHSRMSVRGFLEPELAFKAANLAEI